MNVMPGSKPQKKSGASDKPRESFMALSAVLCLFWGVVFFTLALEYRYPNAHARGVVIAALMAAALAMLLLTALSTWALLHLYNTQNAGKILLHIAKTGFDFLLPVLFVLSKYFKRHKSAILIFCIRLNNTLVRAGGKKYLPADTLILLPHCLQNSACPHKVTGSAANCRLCGGCAIGGVKQAAQDYGIGAVAVATGGTAARSIVAKAEPALIIAVACERDLASGIADVRGVPVIGVLNKRPNGPCVNTKLGMEEFSRTLDTILQSEKKRNYQDNKADSKN